MFLSFRSSLAAAPKGAFCSRVFLFLFLLLLRSKPKSTELFFFAGRGTGFYYYFPFSLSPTCCWMLLTDDASPQYLCVSFWVFFSFTSECSFVFAWLLVPLPVVRAKLCWGCWAQQEERPLQPPPMFFFFVTPEQDSSWSNAFHPNLYDLVTTAAVWQCKTFGDAFLFFCKSKLSILA